MSSQSQSQFFPRSAVVRELEERLMAPGKHPEVASTYQQLCRDPAVVLAARYLALSAIANKLNLYSAQSNASHLIQEISDHMNAVDPHKLFSSLQHLRQYYPSLYRMNTLAFDTASNTAVDCMHRVSPRTPAVSGFAPPPVKEWEQALPPMDFAPSLAPPSLVTVHRPLAAPPDRRPILLGGSLVATSIVAGSFFLLGRNLPQPTPPTTAIASPTVLPSPSVAPAPPALPTVTPTVFPSYSASAGQPPSAIQNQSQPASVIPLPVPTRNTKATRSTPSATAGNPAPLNPNNPPTDPGSKRLKAVPLPTTTAASSSPDSNGVANRPSTTGFINRYYAKLKNGQSEQAWQDLTSTLQSNPKANPGGYRGDYAQWWAGLGQRTQVGKVETVRATAETAVVQAHCRYGQASYIAEYYLIFDQTSQAWKINRIKKLS